jgi:tetratricopeptide (TPR) repeat protein
MAIEMPAIYRAAQLGQGEKVRALLAGNPALANLRGWMGFVPLHGAVGNIHAPEVTLLLLDAGADVNAQNDNGIAPLHLAGSSELVDILVGRGADLNRQANDGSTPVCVHASERDHGRTMVRLLELGADPNVPNNRGQTALDIAIARYDLDRQRGEPDKVDVLMRFGARPGRKDLADEFLVRRKEGKFNEHPFEADEFPGAGLLATPEELDDEIQRLVHQAGVLASSDLVAALELQKRAYELLPEPRTAYYDSIWLLRDIGVAQFRLGRYAEGKATLTKAVTEVAGAAELADLCLCLGQCLFELGEPEADDWLVTAYQLGGQEVFRGEDPKYLAHVRRLLEARPRSK